MDTTKPIVLFIKPASVDQLDTRLTGDQEFSGSIPAASATSFRAEIDHEIFSTVNSLPSADSRRAVVSFLHNSG